MAEGGTIMKLRNKKTGEIGYPYFQNWKEITCVIVDENAKPIAEYTSLAELNEEWEDYEEPEKYWYISPEGIACSVYDDLEGIRASKAIGNYFETEEEAEKAVEKLKAFKRLKDKGFRFNGWNGTEIGSNISYISELYYEGCTDDMDLLFGGEE